MQIFLIRHPRPIIDTGVCYGSLDVDCVDPLPIAVRIKARLPAATPVISSPLRRAFKLARAIDARASVDARIAEIDFGQWESVAWNEIERGLLDAWAADVMNFTPPGGESVASLQARVIAFAASLSGPRVALVTHAGVMRTLVGHLRKLPLAEWSRLQFDYGSVTEINTGETPTLATARELIVHQ